MLNMIIAGVEGNTCEGKFHSDRILLASFMIGLDLELECSIS